MWNVSEHANNSNNSRLLCDKNTPLRFSSKHISSHGNQRRMRYFTLMLLYFILISIYNFIKLIRDILLSHLLFYCKNVTLSLRYFTLILLYFILIYKFLIFYVQLRYLFYLLLTSMCDSLNFNMFR